MSDLLIIAPTGWLDLLAPWIGNNYSLSEVQPWFDQQEWVQIEPILIEHNPELTGRTLLDAKMIYQSDGYHVWALFS